MIAPHGGELVDLLARGDERDAAGRARAGLARAVDLSARQAADLELLAIGRLQPAARLPGIGRLEARRRRDAPRGRAAVEHPGDARERRRRRRGRRARAARPRRPAARACSTVEEMFERDPEREAEHVYRTKDAAHPGVAALLAEGTRCLAGPVRVDRPAGAPGRVPALPAAAGAIARRVRRARLEDTSSASRPATRSTARTSTSPSRRSRASTASSSTRSSARRSPTTSRRTCGCAATRR